LALVGTVLPVEDVGMSSSRLVFAIVAACCLLWPGTLPAQEAPFSLDQPSSADLTISMKNGMTIQAKTYLDGENIRSEMTMSGMDMATIFRKDKQKIYEVMVAQKMVMEMDYNPDKFKGYSAASLALGTAGKFDLVGPDTLDGVACTKYKVTADKTKDVFYFWLDVPRKTPIQMAAGDGSFTVKWKNYKVGPQDASLFVPPAGYQVVPMPSLPGTEKDPVPL
jgi:hypothetical protein